MDIFINGVTLQGDFMDADFVGPYEAATRKLQAAAIAQPRQKIHQRGGGLSGTVPDGGRVF